MKAVFSFSTAFWNDVRPGGFADVEAWWCSCALSIHLAKRHLGYVVLHTDRRGAALLAELKLPLDEVHLSLEGFSCPRPLWALLKLDTYRRQTEPFVHLDLDAYVWAPLPARLAGARVLAQGPEDDVPVYDQPVGYLLDHAPYLPDFVREHAAAHGPRIRALNAGLYGGHDLPVLHACVDAALAVVRHPANAPFWAGLTELHAAAQGQPNPFDHFSIVLEQYLPSVYCHQHGIARTFAVTGQEAPYFTHLLAGAKQLLRHTHLLKARVAQDYPATYARVRALAGIDVPAPC